MTDVAVLGLGEAGALYARDLAAAGLAVSGYDPFVSFYDPLVARHASLADALDGASLVVSLVGARAASEVATAAFELMAPSSVFADLNTSSPALKVELAAMAAERGIAFADVAVLAPVPRAGARTPLMASGSGSARFATLMAPVGADIEDIAGDAGDAAARKLVRSAFMKGLAGVVLESMNGASAAGFEAWMRAQIADELGNATLVDRLVDGSRQHAARRVHEVADASEHLRSLGQPSWSTDAAGRWLARLRDEQHENLRA